MSETIRDVPHFDGSTYDASLDHDRLASQLLRVREILLDEEWHTLAELEAALDEPQASISARIRDHRKLKFGGWVVERRRVPNGNGLHEYRLQKPPERSANA